MLDHLHRDRGFRVRRSERRVRLQPRAGVEGVLGAGGFKLLQFSIGRAPFPQKGSRTLMLRMEPVMQLLLQTWRKLLVLSGPLT